MPDSEQLENQILQDLHRGLTDNALMEKYAVSYAELRGLYKELFDSGRLTPASEKELLPLPRTSGSNRMTQRIPPPHYRCQESFPMRSEKGEKDHREDDRHHLDFEMPIYEAERPEVQGRVLDITEKGAKLTGLRAEVGEAINLVALGDTFGDIAPFEFKARCRWMKQEYGGHWTSGFEITEISEEGLRELRKLVQSIDLGI